MILFSFSVSIKCENQTPSGLTSGSAARRKSCFSRSQCDGTTVTKEMHSDITAALDTGLFPLCLLN